ncbi:SURF1 family protein [Ramlibacter tataouinensis]|uniref:SURF1-like protein n=1 Tax=Ramlibacter tataouinensis (strain ATCC BAA-407 / DSM 14655 / LMG 21543 / TTB310) TaxID=365046 RepID=F5XZC5_RAMTT|nr:SURF1 family protein [Ramlibacter tataouinensis]AEG94482.1 cytochrome oxidase complex biogenesis factor-like protein [Ramlibacter tataouinensis TTB310]
MRATRSWLAGLAAASGIAATTALGFWQLGRAQQKLALQASIEERRALAPLVQPRLDAIEDIAPVLHRRIELRGTWVPGRTVFLDNRQMQGRVGFYVATPLRLAGSGDTVLVQRGWAPRDFLDRQRLPAVQTPPGEVVVQGRIAPPPAKLYEFDGAGQGPIRQNLDLAGFRAETGLPLWEAGSVQQLGEASEGLSRDWPAPASGADKNYGYAAQWWAIAGVILILYVWFQFIAPRRRRFPRA